MKHHLKKVYTLFVLLFFSLNLQAQSTPKEFQTKVWQIVRNEGELRGEWNSIYTKVSKTKNYALLQSKRIEWQQNLLRIIKELKALNDVGGVAKYKQALIAYYENEEKTIEVGAIPYEQFTKDTPDSVIKAKELILKKMAYKSYPLLATMYEARVDYDTRNHLKEIGD